MTVIECFEREPIDNIATCLSLRPDTLVFIGEEEELQRNFERYRLFLECRDLSTKIILRSVKRDDINEIIALLSAIIKAGDEVIIDLAGGDELILAAAGAVYERYKDEYPVTLQRIDTQTSRVQDCDGDGMVEKRSTPTVTVKELIELYGGSVTPAKEQFENNVTLEEIRPIWNVVVGDPLWNRKVSALNEFERRAGARAQDMRITIRFGHIQNAVVNYSEKRMLFDRLINDLHAHGIININHRTKTGLSYTYKTAFSRQCLRKEGNILEYKTLLEARALRHNGQPVFGDCLMGVTIDWDGIIHRPIPGGIKDTKNEIDVVLMHGLTPLFVSCKNGKIDDAELYKLNTVTDRFGGDRAKKLLIATNFHPDSDDAKQSLVQRAADMGICFETDAAALTDAEWKNLFLRAIDKN